MNSAIDHGRNLKALLRKARRSSEPTPPFDPRNPVAWLLHSLLLWEATTARADHAYRAVSEAFIDENDLRVALPHEMVDVIGCDYPAALDRCRRIRAVFNHIFRLEHCVSICRLRELSKRDVRQYLDALDGMTPYAAARTALLAFDAHAVPVDSRLREVLVAAEAAQPEADVVQLASWLSRQIRAERARKAHFALQSIVDRTFDRNRTRGTSARTPQPPPEDDSESNESAGQRPEHRGAEA